VPKAIRPSISGKVLSGGKTMERKWAWAFEGCSYLPRLGASFSRKALISSSKAASFSLRINIPVAWGAKTWTMPFLIWVLLAISCISSDNSMKSISPLVWNMIVWLTILKFEIEASIV
jgi:hypothetical protein